MDARYSVQLSDLNSLEFNVDIETDAIVIGHTNCTS